MPFQKSMPEGVLGVVKVWDGYMWAGPIGGECFQMDQVVSGINFPDTPEK